MPPHRVLPSKSDPEARGRLRVFPDLACVAGVAGTGQAGRGLSFGSSEPSGGGGAKGAGAARLADMEVVRRFGCAAAAEPDRSLCSPSGAR